MSNCKHTSPCGCADKGLTTNPPCAVNTPDCPNPEPCSETFSDECILHSGDTIVDLDIKKGDRLSDILQKLTLLLTNNACILPGAVCQSPVGFGSTAIYTTSVKLAWDATPNATSYQVEYKTVAALTWALNTAVAQSAFPIDTIGGLLPNTEYYIRVRAICGIEPTTCPSVTISVKTKS